MHKHWLDMRGVIFGRYFDLRVGKDIRSEKRPCDVPVRVWRRNNLAMIIIAQMILSWLAGIVLLFGWIFSVGCGTTAPGGELGTESAASAEATNKLPVISGFSVSPVKGYAPLTVTASVSAYDIDGRVVRYTIDFNSDGVNEYDKTTVPRVGYIYSKDGVNTVTATVYDNMGGKASKTVQVRVLAPEVVVTPETITLTDQFATTFVVSRASFGGAFSWSAKSDKVWATMSPAYGSIKTTVKVMVNKAKLPPAGDTATITVTSSIGKATLRLKVQRTGGVEVIVH